MFNADYYAEKLKGAPKAAEELEQRYYVEGSGLPGNVMTHDHRARPRLAYEVGIRKAYEDEMLAYIRELERQVKVSIERRDVETLLVGFAHDLGLEDIDEEDAHRYMQESGYFQDELVGVQP